MGIARATTIGLPAVTDDTDFANIEFTARDGIGRPSLIGFGNASYQGENRWRIWCSGKGLRIGFDVKI